MPYTGAAGPGADCTQDLARRVRSALAVAKLRQVDDDRIREARRPIGRPVPAMAARSGTRTAASAPVATALVALVFSFLLSRSDAPETTRMRRAFGLQAAGEIDGFADIHVCERPPLRQVEVRGGFEDLAGPAGKHQSCARPKLRAVPIEELQCALADRDDHVEPKSRVFLGEKRDQLGFVSLDLEALRIERLGKVDDAPSRAPRPGSRAWRCRSPDRREDRGPCR